MIALFAIFFFIVTFIGIGIAVIGIAFNLNDKLIHLGFKIAMVALVFAGLFGFLADVTSPHHYHHHFIK